MESIEDISLAVNAEALKYAKIISSVIQNKKQRKRAYASIVALDSFAEYLLTRGLNLNINKNLFKVAPLNEEFEISDIYYNGWHIDVRVVLFEEFVTIPKKHFDFGIMPDFYVVAKPDSSLKFTEIVGYIEAENIDLSSDKGDYYIVNLSEVLPVNDLLTKIEKKNTSFKSSNKHDNFENNYLAYLDGELDDTAKSVLIKHLINCSDCREKLVEFFDFEAIVKHSRIHHELFEDHTLNFLGGQILDSKRYGRNKNEAVTKLNQAQGGTQIIGGLFTGVPTPSLIGATVSIPIKNEMPQVIQIPEEIKDDDDEIIEIPDEIKVPEISPSNEFSDEQETPDEDQQEQVTIEPDNDLISFDDDSELLLEDGDDSFLSLDEDIAPLDEVSEVVEDTEIETTIEPQNTPLNDEESLMGEADSLLDEEEGEDEISWQKDTIDPIEEDSDYEDKILFDEETQSTEIQDDDTVNFDDDIPSSTEYQDDVTEKDLDAIELDDDLHLDGSNAAEDDSVENDFSIQDFAVESLSDDNGDISEEPILEDMTFESGLIVEEENFEDKIVETPLAKSEDAFDEENKIEPDDSDKDFLNSSNQSFDSDNKDLEEEKLTWDEEQTEQNEGFDSASVYDQAILNDLDKEEKPNESDSQIEDLSMSPESFFNISSKSSDAKGYTSEVDQLYSPEPQEEEEADKKIVGLSLINNFDIKEKKVMILVSAVVSCVLLATLLGVSIFIKKGKEQADIANQQMYNQSADMPVPTEQYPQQSDLSAVNPNLQDILKQPLANTPRDINKSMTNVFAQNPSSVTVTKIAWEVPQSMAANPPFAKYLQLAGKNLQLNLKNDLTGATEFAYNDKIRVGFMLTKDNQINDLKVIDSSGSEQIDQIVLQSIKATLKYVNVPQFTAPPQNSGNINPATPPANNLSNLPSYNFKLVINF
jgi:hypothetical protein